MRQTSVSRLFEQVGKRLELTHICGTLDRTLSVSEERVWPADLVGHLNLIHPERMQIIGMAEIAWARRQTANRLARYVEEILSARPPALIVADGCDVPPTFERKCEPADVALFRSPQPAASVVDQLRLYLSREMAERTALHGVFMDVLGLGVFITGDSGAGKSELALELISRGHGLVADDMVEFSRIAPTVLEGRCPELLKNYLEVRGIGILNIRTIFGETACRRKMRLKLVIYLQRRRPGEGDPTRLPIEQDTMEILGVPVPKMVIPVAAGRNIAVLLEAAVRTTILQLRGIDTTQEFIARQRALLLSDNPD